MHNGPSTIPRRHPQSATVLQHAIDIAKLARPIVAVIQRKDSDLASQLRRAISSVALNLAQAQGNSGGNGRVRYERSALGSLYEAQAGVQLAVAWGYVSWSAVAEVFSSVQRRGGRVFGLVRR